MAVRRHPLALLALLAAHREQGMSRDKVVAYLWPESDAQRARNSLKQDCFALRHALGRCVIASSPGALRLDPILLDADVWRFEAALLSKQPAGAAALYQGPFLDGFFLAGLGEFERWSEAERARLAGLYAEALESLAQEADRTGELSSAVAWWRRLTALDPLSSRSALGLARALEAAGDAPAALEHAQRHAAMVQAELGASAPPEVTAFTQRLGVSIRAPTRRWAPPPAPLPWPPPFRLLPTSHWPVVGRLSRSLPGSPSRPRRAPHWLMALLVGVAVSIAAGWERWADRTAAAMGPEALASVAVLPFTVAGGGPVAGLGAGLDDLLASRLDGADGLRGYTISSRIDRELSRAVRVDRQLGAAVARRASARFYVIGTLVGAGDQLQAAVTLYDRGNANAPAARAEATVVGMDLFGLADRLAVQLIAGLTRSRSELLAERSAGGTNSLPALKAYLEGERRFRADSFPLAVGAFRRAVRADTAFALAYYRLSLAAEQDQQDDLAQWAAIMADRFGEDRPDPERQLIQGHLAYRRGRVAEAERLLRRAVAGSTEDAEAWLRLGEVRFQANPGRGRSATEARTVLEHGLTLDPSDHRGLVRLARIAVLEGRQAEAEWLIVRAVAQAPDSLGLAAWAFREFIQGSRPDGSVLTDLFDTPGQVSARWLLRAVVNLEDLDGIEELGTRIARSAGTCAARASGQLILSQVAVAEGRPRLAASRLQSAGACQPAASLELRVAYASMPFLRPDSQELARLRRALESGRASGPATWMEAAVAGLPTTTRQYYQGLLALRAGDTVRAQRAILPLTASAGLSDADRARSLRARLALDRDRPHRALALLEGGDPPRGDSPVLEAGDRFLRAELLRVVGREEEAIAWYGSIAERSLPELAYLAPAELHLAQIYEMRGDHAEALRHRERFRELWREPEPAAGLAARSTMR